jgi:hypothetical protein
VPGFAAAVPVYPREGIRLVVKRAKTALESLGPEEAAKVLAGLVRKHPELTAEAEELAAREDSGSVGPSSFAGG